MEILATRPPDQETFKHFDLLASVDLLRFDLQREGRVLPETMARVYDEELSYVAEGIDRPVETIFALKEIDGQFMYFSKGEWQPYDSLLIKGITSAEAEAEKDPRKSFLVDMAATDWVVAQKWKSLQPGEKMHWYSPFREREYRLYGEKFMNELGFQPKRRMGFLYQAERSFNGDLVLTTVSVDNSDEEAFTAAMQAADNENDITAGRKAYDEYLGLKHGRKFTAGRLKENEENAWEIIEKQRDLVTFYFDQLENLARNPVLNRQELERQKKRLTYSFWAAIKERMDAPKRGVIGGGTDNIPRLTIAQEMTQAYTRLQAKGEVLFGCGGAISAEDPLIGADTASVFDSIFGKPQGDKYGSLKFKCPRGHENTRPRNKLIEKCKTCGTSVIC